MNRSSPRQMFWIRNSGFTLIELVVAMTLTTLVIGFVAMFMTAPVDAYISQSERSHLNDSATTITRSLEEDLRNALPNSVRIRNSGTRSILELLKVEAVSFYRPTGQLGSTAAREFDVAPTTETQFSLFGRLNMSPTSGYLVVANLGTGFTPRDAYRLTNSGTIMALTPGRMSVVQNVTTLEEQVTLTPGFLFAASDTTNRMFLVSGPVSYICNSAANMRALHRYESYPVTTTIPTTETSAQLAGSTNTRLASNVTSCRLRCISDNAIDNVCGKTLSVEITVTRLNTAGNEPLRIFEQFPVDNST